MADQTFVSFCDILGFADLVEQSSIEDVVQNALGWLRKSIHHSLHHDDFPTEVPSFSELVQHSHLGLTWFSDSILIWSRDDSDECTRRLLESLAWLHFETIISGRTMIRSGVAYGPVHIDPENSIFVGSTIIEAYRLQQDQEWSGGALAASAVARLPAAVRSKQFADWWVVPYSVPLKNGPLKTLALNWPQGMHQPDWQLRWSDDRPPKSDVVRNLENTRAFHTAVCQRCGRRPTNGFTGPPAASAAQRFGTDP